MHGLICACCDCDLCVCVCVLTAGRNLPDLLLLQTKLDQRPAVLSHHGNAQ